MDGNAETGPDQIDGLVIQDFPPQLLAQVEGGRMISPDEVPHHIVIADLGARS